eukprot:987743-Amphidinium_carterae.3
MLECLPTNTQQSTSWHTSTPRSGLCRKEEARCLDLPWPRPVVRVVRVGRPSMDLKWQQVLYKSLDSNDFPSLAALSDAKAPPPWWRPGVGIKESMKEGSAVAAAVGHMLVQDEPVIVLNQEQAVLDQDQVATEEPDKKKRENSGCKTVADL